MNKQFKVWKEATRPRTLPVSVSGVLIAIGLTKWAGGFSWAPAILCLVFALLAQIVSNFANEYYDFESGADKKGRAGFRRGVTEGDIKPETMKRVMFIVLGIDLLIGLCMLLTVEPEPWFQNWLMLIGVGIVVALGLLAYSTGPYPLSYHALGEVAVFLFYGIVPVVFTYYVITGSFSPFALMASMCIGFMGVNVLLVNNYRDVADDREAGKRTSVVVFGRPAASAAYLINGLMGISLLSALWVRLCYSLTPWVLVAPAIYLVLHCATWAKLRRSDGAALNPLLGATARNMLIFTVILVAFLIFA